MLARVAGRRTLANPEYFELEIEAPEIARSAEPGQFLYIRTDRRTGRSLLRRAFSIAGTEGGRVAMLIKRVGEGTAALSQTGPRDELDVLGPLGNGYDLSGQADDAILVAGGYGIAPLFFLAARLREKSAARRIWLLGGARTAPHLLWRDRIEAAEWLRGRFATEDGSIGVKGTVVDLAAGVMKEAKGGVRMFACGPMAMLGALRAKWPRVALQVATESQMGCGIGACMGCVIPTRPGSRYGKYARVCMEGPVFPAADIDWAAVAAAGKHKVQGTKHKGRTGR